MANPPHVNLDGAQPASSPVELGGGAPHVNLDQLTAPAPQQQGGIWGSVMGAVKTLVVKPAEATGHYVARQAVDVGEGVGQIPTGLYDVVNTEQHLIRKTIAHPLANPNDPRYGVNKGKWGKHANALVKGLEQNVVHTAEHPTENLFNTFTLALPLAGGVARVGLAADAARVGDISAEAPMSSAAQDLGMARKAESPKMSKSAVFAKALVKPVTKTRTLSIPKLEGPGPGLEGPVRLTSEKVMLPTSEGSLGRVLQAGVDTATQRALDKIPQTGETTRLGRYGLKRAAGSIGEGSRIAGNLRGATAVTLERAKADKGLSKDEVSLAHFLRSNNVTPEEWSQYGQSQIQKLSQAGGKTAKGDIAQHERLAAVADSLVSKGVLTQDSAGNVVINAEQYPKLAAKDEALGKAQTAREDILTQHGLMDEESLRTRKDLVGRLVAGGKLEPKYEQVAKERLRVGQKVNPSDRKNVGTISSISEDGKTAQVDFFNKTTGLRASKTFSTETLLRRTGKEFVGGESARPGQGYTSLRSTRPIAAQSGMARAAGTIIGKASKNGLSLGKEATGKSVERGQIPADTARGASADLRAANRFANTTELRGKLAGLGSDVRQTEDDVLVAEPTGPLKEVPPELKILMGKLSDQITPAEESKLWGKYQDYVKTLVNHTPDQKVGERAPEGYKFVNKNLVPDALTESLSPRGKGEKIADSLNSAVTTATVYTKVGHLPQRLLTNATTNFIQGSMRPLELAKTVKMTHRLTNEQNIELDALTGSHASQAPLIGATTVGKRFGVIALGRKLAGGWARRVDAPFRVNSILYELRSIGYDTPEKVGQALEALKDPTRSGLSGSQIMKLDGAVRRSNRAAIMYDGLSAAEKRNVARYVWFYPWTKGAVRYAGHTVAEHPVKASVLGALGAQGLKKTRSELGTFPTYESNLTVLGKGKSGFPLVSNLSSLSPYGTTADTAMLFKQPFGEEGLPSLANPALSGVENVVKGQGVKGFFEGLVSPTPEYQIGSALKNPKGSGLFPTTSKNLFGTTGESSLLRALTGGTSTPRRVNKSKLNEYALRQHEKAKTFTVYTP